MSTTIENSSSTQSVDNKSVERAVVAMSGGVDSSVSALLLAREGVDSIGISMQVWDYRQNGGCSSRATCCSPDDFTDARKVAASIGIPYYVFDFEKHFRAEVIDKFVDTYQRGETPNPCIDCNSKVKFKELRNRARALGCSHVATGHYARISQDQNGFHLLRGIDSAKDQSYFLYNLTQDELSQTIFPVGHMTKQEVRALAAEAGLVTASKPESQDICFVSGTVQEFLVQLGAKGKRGNITTRQGEKIGEHEGIHTVTVGQRKGIGIRGMQQPHYVLEIDAEENRVIVGPKEELQRDLFFVNQLNWIAPTLNQSFQKGEQFTFEAMAQLRHRHKGTPVSVTVRPCEQHNGEVRAEVRFVNEWATAAPGQAAVFYSLDNQEVLGGGRILTHG